MARPGLDRGLEAGLDAARRVHDEQGGIGRVEALDHLGDEVRVAGRVDDRDLVLAVLERADGEAQRAVLLLLLGLVVEVRGAVVDPAQPRDRAGAKQHLLRSVVFPLPAWPASTTLRMWARSWLFNVIARGSSSVVPP